MRTTPSHKILTFCFLLSILTSACGSKSGPATKKLTSADERVEITVPAGWKEEKELNDKADLQASHRPSEMYVVVLSEAKVDFDEMTLEGHSKLTRQKLMDGINTPLISAPFAMKVGEFPAVQYEIRGSVDRVNIVYLHTTAESSEYFHQIIAWTVPSRFEKNKETLQKVVALVRELPQSAASDAPHVD